MAKVYPSRADNRLLSDSFLINDESIGSFLYNLKCKGS